MGKMGERVEWGASMHACMLTLPRQYGLTTYSIRVHAFGKNKARVIIVATKLRFGTKTKKWGRNTFRKREEVTNE